MVKNNLVFITHILENIEKIESFTKDLAKEGFLKDELKQYAVVRAIEIIGEASKNLSEDFKKEHPEVEWKEIIGARDKISHHYFGIKLSTIWNIITNDLPDLKKKVKAIIEKNND